MNKSGWRNFWLKEQNAFVKTMTVATQVFGERFLSEFKPHDNSTLLDFGCGPGLLADTLSQTTIKITGADINSYFLEEYKRKHPHAHIVYLNPDREGLPSSLQNSLGPQKFDYIILLSIVQYFRDRDEVRDTLRILSNFLKHDGKIVLADVVPYNHSKMSDAFDLIRECFRRNSMIEMIRFLNYLVFSSYRKVSNTTGLLRLSQEQIEEIVEEIQMKCTRTGALTIHRQRMNFILEPIPKS